MTLGTPFAVLLSILFLIPGFIWKKTGQVFSPYAPTGKIELLECLMLSCLNYLLGLPVIYVLLLLCPRDLDLARPESLVRHPWYLGVWLAIVFVLPLGAGLLFAKISASTKVTDWLRRFGVSVLHPAPTAWDYVFARNERYWARVELDDGTFLTGLFDADSVASGRSDRRDLFLEDVFEWKEDARGYEKVPRNAGAWVSAERIRQITFFSTDPSQVAGADLESEQLPQDSASPEGAVPKDIAEQEQE